MTAVEIKKKLADLKINSTEAIVVGSGILDVLGIRPSNDIDLLISREVFYQIAARGYKILHRLDGSERIEIGNIELMYDWYGERTSSIKMKTTMIEGLEFMSIEELRDWKVRLNREKDRADVLLIDQYLVKC